MEPKHDTPPPPHDLDVRMGVWQRMLRPDYVATRGPLLPRGLRHVRGRTVTNTNKPPPSLSGGAISHATGGTSPAWIVVAVLLLVLCVTVGVAVFYSLRPRATQRRQ